MSKSYSESRSASPRSHRYSRSNSYPNKDMTCLYVSNLSSKVTTSDLKDLFERYGVLEYANICMEPRRQSQGKISRGFGFVKYSLREDTAQALQQLQDYELYGKRIHLEYSKRAEARRKTPGKYAGYTSRRRSISKRRRRSTSSSSSYIRRRQLLLNRIRRYSRSRSRRRRSYYRRSPSYSYSDSRYYRRRRDYSSPSYSRSRHRKSRKYRY